MQTRVDVATAAVLLIAGVIVGVVAAMMMFDANPQLFGTKSDYVCTRVSDTPVVLSEPVARP